MKQRQLWVTINVGKKRVCILPGPQPSIPACQRVTNNWVGAGQVQRLRSKEATGVTARSSPLAGR